MASDREIKRKFRKTWSNIIYRCTNPNDRKFQYYNKRGIARDWLDFEVFKSDMYGSFLDHVCRWSLANTTLDRVDNDGPYCVENCRWATWEDQNNNSSKRKGKNARKEHTHIDFKFDRKKALNSEKSVINSLST